MENNGISMEVIMEKLEELTAQVLNNDNKEQILASLQDTTDKVSSLSEQVEKTTSKIEEVTTELSAIKDENAKLNNAVTQLNIGLEDSRNQMKQMQITMDAQNDQIEELTKQIRQVGEKLSHQSDTLRSLAKIQAGTLTELGFDKTLHSLEVALQDYTGVKNINVFMHDVENDALYHADAEGNKSYIPKDTAFAKVFEDGSPVMYDIAEMMNQRFAGYADTRTSDNCVIVPIRSKDNKIIGVAYGENADREDIPKFDLINSENAAIKEFGLCAETIIATRERNIDKLTGIYNGLDAPAVQKFIQNDIYNALQSEKDVCVIYCDIDHFKGFNDTYGHDVGDMVLRQVAQTMKSAVRDEDCVIRLHGEEMAVIVPATIDIAEMLATRINERVAETPLDIGNKNVSITISAGVAKVNPSVLIETTRDQLPTRIEKVALKEADKQLYIAKENGRNAVAVQGKEFTPKENYISSFIARNDLPIAAPYFFSKGEPIATLEMKDKDGFEVRLSISAVDDITVQYGGEVYTSPDEYPPSLREAILNGELQDIDYDHANTLLLSGYVSNANGDKIPTPAYKVDFDPSGMSVSEIKAILADEALANLEYGKNLQAEKTAQVEKTATEKSNSYEELNDKSQPRSRNKVQERD